MQWLFSFHQPPTLPLNLCCPACSSRTGGNAACTSSATISAPSPLRPTGARGRAVFAQQKHRSLMERRSIQPSQPDGEAGRFISSYRLRSCLYNLPELVAKPPVPSPQQTPLKLDTTSEQTLTYRTDAPLYVRIIHYIYSTINTNTLICPANF